MVRASHAADRPGQPRPGHPPPPDPNFTLPYWRWHIDRSPPLILPLHTPPTGYLWRDEMLGGKNPSSDEITGPFDSWTALVAKELTESGVVIETEKTVIPGHAGTIKRHFGAGTNFALPNAKQVGLVQFAFPLLHDRFDVSPFDYEASWSGSYRNRLEGLVPPRPFGWRPGEQMHNEVHNWFGGTGIMSDVAFSPNDPVFWLHHSECDRLWWLWQNSVRSAGWWPTDEELKHVDADRDYAAFTRTTALPPWDGKTYTLGEGDPKAYPKITVADVLDIEHLPIDLLGPGTGDVSYRYDRKTL